VTVEIMVVSVATVELVLVIAFKPKMEEEPIGFP